MINQNTIVNDSNDNYTFIVFFLPINLKITHKKNPFSFKQFNNF